MTFKPVSLLASALVLGLWSSSVALAAPPMERWADGSDHDPAIPRLDDFLGRPFAERHTTVDEILRYCEELATASDRIEVEVMGRSVQGDPLLLLVVTDPANRAALSRRPELLASARDAWEGSGAQRRAAAAELLPVTWIACSVHGDEASGSDAGLALAYHLAADRSEATRRVLRDSVVLISPSQNPDGRRRFLQHVRSFGRQKRPPDPSPWAAEHQQLWPGGRTNHFLFDLNRDWAFLTQQESRFHVASFLRWRPQVFVDLHEMGRDSSYYFPPPAEPINPNVSREQREWFEVFGRANAAAFDARGFDYFVREDFDLFYPGYGDSWPTLQGAVGMTYEQATTRGRALRQTAGQIVGYEDAVERHFVAAWTTVRTAAEHGRELLDSYVRFHEIGREHAENDPRRELVLSVATHGAEAARLAETLVRQGVVVWRTLEQERLRLTPYDEAQKQEIVLPAGSFRVPLEQPAHALVRSLLDPHTPMEESFLEQERLRRERGLRSRFYDVTAWSMIFTHGVVAYTSDRRLKLPSEPVIVPLHADERVVRQGGLVGSEGSDLYGWVVPYEDNSALSMLLELWAVEAQVSCALDAFETGGRSFPRGSFVVKRSANQHVEDLDRLLDAAGQRLGLRVQAVASAWTEAGLSLGSNRVVPLRPPEIGLLIGPGLSPLSAGGLNWLLEDRYGVTFTSLLLPTIGNVDLNEFDVLILPEVRSADALPVDELRRWVEAGGLLIAVGAATAPLIEADEPFTSARLVRDLAELADEEGRLGDVEIKGMDFAADDEEESLLPPERRPLRTPGAILRIRLDPTHPLTLGEGELAHAPLLSDRILLPSVEGRNVGLIDENRPRAAGFMWPVMEEAVRGKGYLIEEEQGDGRVVLFAEDPGFRGTWEGLHRLLLNGVLIAPSLLN